MRAIICLLLVAVCLPAQNRFDQKIQKEYQDVMALAAAPADGSTMDEEAAKARAESFKASMDTFLDRWGRQLDQLTTGQYIYARALLVGGKPKEAIPVLKAFLRDHPKSQDAEEARISLGGAYLDSKQLDLAVATFEAFMKERPTSDRLHVASYYLGMARYQLGQIEASLALIKSVIDSGRQDSIVIDANIKYVEFLKNAGRVEPARVHLARLLAELPDGKYLLTLKEQLDTIGKLAPEIVSVSSWLNGSPQTLEKLKGQVVVLTFFQHWPQASRYELAAMALLHQELAGEGAFFLALTKFYEPFSRKTREGQIADVTVALEKQGVTYPTGITDDFKTLRAYMVRGVPQTVVIGKDGRIAYVKYGASRGNTRAVEDLKQAILRALR